MHAPFQVFPGFRGLTMPDRKSHNPTPKERDERVSIHTDLTPEEALALLLQVDPESEPIEENESAPKP